MIVTVVSDCEGKAINKTRKIMNRFLPQISNKTWSGPITQKVLDEMRLRLKKVATKSSSIACYQNLTRISCKQIWTIGSVAKRGFLNEMAIASRSKKQVIDLPAHTKALSLLAQTMAISHDFGKANVYFQNKIRGQAENISDPIRHEWLSVLVANRIRKGTKWCEAWEQIGQLGPKELNTLMLGDRAINSVQDSIQTDLFEALDFGVLTHHGLLGLTNSDGQIPNLERHVKLNREQEFSDATKPYGELEPEVIQQYLRLLERTKKATVEQTNRDYWQAISYLARSLLIYADQTVSMIQIDSLSTEEVGIYANSNNNGGLNQSLKWHLQHVCNRIPKAVKQFESLAHELPCLDDEVVENLRESVPPKSRFAWQNQLAKECRKFRDSSPTLVFNLGGTGSGKTVSNVRAASELRSDNLRLAICLNLRNLTLQSGADLKSHFSLQQEDIATVIGDQSVAYLFEKFQADLQKGEDQNEDGNIESGETIDIDSIGFEHPFPLWLESFYEGTPRQKTVLTSPILVSTIDYLINASNPGKQAYYIKAQLRVRTSDLILDEIDSFDPNILVSVLNLIEQAALFGRNVICSTATLAKPTAHAIESAYRKGITQREALGLGKGFNIVIADNYIQPESFNIPEASSVKQNQFVQTYSKHLQQILDTISQSDYTKIGRIVGVPESSDTAKDRGYTTSNPWVETICNTLQKGHERHCWALDKTNTISFCLIRMANVKPIQKIALEIALSDPEIRICVYHGKDILLNRSLKEKTLDHLLRRSDKKKWLNKVQSSKEIRNKLSNTGHTKFVVIASPVEEIGRDHDFDFAIIEPSSISSILQTAGRVNRHRLDSISIDEPNVYLMDMPYKMWHDVYNKKSMVGKRYFKHPGLEKFSENPYHSHHLYGKLFSKEGVNSLAPNIFAIDASLRFKPDFFLFSKYDDEAIELEISKYYQDELGIFSTGKSPVLSVKTMQNIQLRQKDQTRTFRLNKREGEFFIEQQIYKKLHSLSKPKMIWEPIPKNQIKFIATPDQAWNTPSLDEIFGQAIDLDDLKLLQFNIAFTKQDESRVMNISTFQGISF